MLHSKTSLAFAVILFTAGTSQAQPNPNLKPTYGAVTLNSGFLPDPYTKELLLYAHCAHCGNF